MDDAQADVMEFGLTLRLKNAAASIAVAMGATAYYCFVPYYQGWISRSYGPPEASFTGSQFLWAAGACYSLALFVVFVHPAAAGISKSLRCLRLIGRWLGSPVEHYRKGLAPEDRLALLSTLLKCYFGPMMVLLLMQWAVGAWLDGRALLETWSTNRGFLEVFNTFGFWFVLKFILFWDVFFYTAGYLVESPRLGNQIRSVDPTLVGWGAALMCYAPLSTLTGALLGTPREDFPHFDDPVVHVTMNLLSLVILAIYTSASVALGFKASNLTHRGIVSRGPYAIVRHPAYVCKNAAWWIGGIPIIGFQLQHSVYDALLTVGSIIAWSAVYVLRALTEEDHLRSVDGDYDVYAAKVRYRFIPGLI